MKYMRLGSKPDTFQNINTNNNKRAISAGSLSDITIQVQDTVFHLHKFLLLSKCGRLLRLINNAATGINNDDGDDGVLYIEDMPGGLTAFELCMKFCYGITIILNAHNIMSVRCAADYLEMTDKFEKGSLVFKLEVFLSSSIFKSWRDSVIALKTTKSLLPWSRDYKLVGRCIDSIASMVSTETSKINWSFTYTRRRPKHHGASPKPMPKESPRESSVPVDWWVEDVCDLDVALFYSVMMAIKSKGIISGRLISDALRIYAYKWLPCQSREYNNASAAYKHSNTSMEMQSQEKYKTILETIVGLLPSNKGSSSCRFLLRLLRAAMFIGSDRLKTELIRRISKQLHEASLDDILIPSVSYANDSLYDVDLIQSIVEQFMMQGCARARTQNNADEGTLQIEEVVEDDGILKLTNEEHKCIECHGSSPMATQLLQVAKLIDEYLAEIARDKNLPLAKFMNVAGIIPEFARPMHDGLYRAIDIYLKEHPNLSKYDKKKLCKLMDCKKLSRDACIHVAQNERLPLRVVVQVVFFEQVRMAMANKPLQVKDILHTSAKTRTNSTRTQ